MFQAFDSLPRGLMASGNILLASAAYFADWSHTHVFNPRWPPHAKFHNGQSMSFGALSALTSLYLLSRRNANIEAAKDSLFVAAIVGSLTTVAGLSAIFYPGTAWTDPEFGNFGWIGPQGYVFLVQLFVNWTAYYFENARLDKLDKLKK
ncbi:uncharacterized protein TRIVIDRAFT_39154 [Trichoderma virens Gv29-8]|uniref:Uncharacterized protein n=1 Tax=Hypocrea virens (strain Gv29-8 / FGSC 10586) TaxID=413071 RepID=G9NC58_HYPVG|nr:uncharacterized protein TRIVIDRAFT_39154 [Trichoderma virens Gv29-8]EHK15283.1 hypothetical protein TRIVIDRAFT_39154 [Trichoderma virens Gv29-8]UKZ51227.1 hypothetical protein TrVGV298_004984 [Trichoderma virens]